MSQPKNFSLKSACVHPKWIAVESVLLTTLFPEEKDFLGVNIRLNGLPVSRCAECGKVLLLNEQQYKKDELLAIARDLAGAESFRGKAITFSAIANANLPQAANEEKVAEQAEFEPTSPRFGFESVILNPDTKLQIDEAVIRVNFGALFYQKLGFEKIKHYGKGTILNFFGPPGTGKTKTAEALAGAMNLKFLDINIAELESRYVSQTSKNICRAFQAAREEKCVIFFDEADTVLGKRLSNVTQGIDAEINSSRAVMLKELEGFDGICIFATNFPSNIDRAFIRRIQYHIEFRLPDDDTRTQLWKYMLLDTFSLAGDRKQMIANLMTASAGLSGSDIANAIELSFPHAYLLDNENPLFTENDLLDGVLKVKKAAAVPSKESLNVIKINMGINNNE